MFRFAILPDPEPLWRTQWYDQVLRFLQPHPWRTPNPADADVLIPELDTALETNWPRYGQSQSAFLYGGVPLYHEHRIRKLNELPVCHPPGRLLLFDMNPFSGFPDMARGCDNILLAANSFHQSQYRAGLDISFPSCSIIQFDRPSVESNQDTILVSFVGYDSHPVRRQLAQLHNGRDVVVLNSADRPHLGRATTQSSLHQDEVRPFASILLRSRFGFVPRGDALFSYRLFETMAAGAVPVVLSDGWVLPFSEFLNWGEFSLRIPENQADRCLDLLRSMPDEQVLQMRRKALWVYRQFFATVEIQLQWLLRLLNERLNHAILAHPQPASAAIPSSASCAATR